MAKTRYKPEQIVGLLRQADVLDSQGKSMSDAIRQIGVREVTFYRWRKEHGGLSGDHLHHARGLPRLLAPARKDRPVDHGEPTEGRDPCPCCEMKKPAFSRHQTSQKSCHDRKH